MRQHRAASTRSALATIAMLCILGGFLTWLYLAKRIALLELGAVILMGLVLAAVVTKLYAELWDEGDEP